MAYGGAYVTKAYDIFFSLGVASDQNHPTFDIIIRKHAWENS
jgi:hypothetical protein